MEQLNLTNVGIGLTIAILILREVLPYVSNRVNGHSSNPHRDTLVSQLPPHKCGGLPVASEDARALEPVDSGSS